jgi:16S rRNA (guanine966-N2)-methyltransferase
VTRIIAGTARGRRLRVPHGARPTTDRVRESLFASLEHMLGGFGGLEVLDLYAGSGALGLEAVSRGAARAVLVERDRAAAGVARANAGIVGGKVEVVVASVGTYLARPASPFDLVLADPPYDLPRGRIEAVLALLARGWLADQAVVVVERPAREGDLAWPRGIVAVRRSVYGSTGLWYGRGGPRGEDR